MTGKKKILFICHMSTFFTEQLGIIKLCLGNNIIPIIQFACYIDSSMVPCIEQCLKINIDIYDKKGNKITNLDDVEIIQHTTGQNEPKKVKQTLKRRFVDFKNNPVNNWSDIKQRFQFRKFVTRKILNEVKPNLVMLGCDIPGHDTAVCIQEAHRYGIKTSTVTIAMSNGDDVDFFVTKETHSMKYFLNRIAGLLFPNWVWNYKGKKVLRLPASYILYYKLHGIEPPKPWLFNSGYIDSIILDGKAYYDYYANAGLDKKKLFTLGNLNIDTLYHIVQNKDELRNQIYEKYHFDKNKKLIVTAIPPKYLMAGMDEFHDNHYELLEYWTKTLKNTNCNVIGCPHPSLDIESLKKYESDNFKIYDGHTVEMVGLADIFVVNISSSMKWAIACGIPVLNFDIQNMNYIQYQIGGIVRAINKQEFENQLKKLTTDDAYYNEIKQKQIEKSQDWGVLDGKAGERILNHLNFLMEKNL